MARIRMQFIQVVEIGMLTLVSLVLLLVVYPCTVAPTGSYSNGGILGLVFLVLGMLCSWMAFMLGRPIPLFRWLVLLPIASIVTWSTVVDVLAQYHSG